MTTPFDHLLGGNDDDRKARDGQFAASIAREPAEKQEYWSEVYAMICSIEASMASIEVDLKDCNVIMARTNSALSRFLVDEGSR